jgi:APA family basic amino acid/polyamine antiporter
MHSKAPYVDAARIVFGGSWHYGISIIASIVCIGTLNAWVLTSGQIALGLAEGGYLPKRFSKTNLRGAPSFGIICSSLGIVPLLFLTNSSSFAEQITSIIDISVISFLFVYVLCCLSLLSLSSTWVNQVAALFALGFCVFIISQTPETTLLTSSIFTLSGLPLYLYWRGSRLKS